MGRKVTDQEHIEWDAFVTGVAAARFVAGPLGVPERRKPRSAR
jgi:hypothetical protein